MTARAPARCRDISVVTCFFDPLGCEARLAALRLFADELRQADIPVTIVEGVAPRATPVAPRVAPAAHVIAVEYRHALWQKERLLNLGIESLPATVSKVAWLDCDILFDNTNWLEDTAAALNEYPVVQPFSIVAKLSEPMRTTYEADPCSISFARSVCERRESRSPSVRHGHPGFAWAAQRRWLESVGLYDTCISSPADHLMAHAVIGEWASSCVSEIVGSGDNAYRRHFIAWARRVHELVQGRIGVVPGRIRHLWHGDRSKRRLGQWTREALTFDFDPAADLRLGRSGAWEWDSDKTALHEWSQRFFAARREASTGGVVT